MKRQYEQKYGYIGFEEVNEKANIEFFNNLKNITKNVGLKEEV